MQDLLQRITDQAGISLDQATKAVDAIKGYVKEKVPAVEGMLDSILHGKTATSATEAAKEFGTDAKEFLHKAGDKAEDVFDDVKEKLSPYADKVGDFTEDAIDKAGETFKDLGKKIGDFFDGDDAPKK